jgi:hypothetical protein
VATPQTLKRSRRKPTDNTPNKDGKPHKKRGDMGGTAVPGAAVQPADTPAPSAHLACKIHQQTNTAQRTHPPALLTRSTNPDSSTTKPSRDSEKQRETQRRRGGTCLRSAGCRGTRRGHAVQLPEVGVQLPRRHPPLSHQHGQSQPLSAVISHHQLDHDPLHKNLGPVNSMGAPFFCSFRDIIVCIIYIGIYMIPIL